MTGILNRLRTNSGLQLASIGTAIALLAAGPASAQAEQPGYSIDLSTPSQTQSPGDAGPQQKAGSLATSSVGTLGQRQEQSESMAHIKPMARLDTRIANRVESRIRNRIDRFYGPQANATSPFKVAADQVQSNLARSSR